MNRMVFVAGDAVTGRALAPGGDASWGRRHRPAFVGKGRTPHDPGQLWLYEV
jgi:hypothetical protein